MPRDNEESRLKKILLTLCAASLTAMTALAPLDVEAKRLGGGKTTGMQRQAPPPQPAAPTQQGATPAQNPAAVPNNAAAPQPAAPAAGKRSWMGPLAGLAAGLGLAALASHFGFGEALANVMMIALLAMAALFLFAWFKRRNQPAAAAGNNHGMAFAGAGAPMPAQQQPWAAPATPAVNPGSTLFNGMSAAAPAPRPLQLPPGFDQASFEAMARTIFTRLQAANDAGRIEDLRPYTSDALYAVLQADLRERGGRTQHTEIEELHAQVLETVQEQGQSIISVRFHGRLREDGVSDRFDELWHLTQPIDGSRDWLIAGIQQHG
ncbi:MAG: hypothetical protein RJA44_659 [Pseudomonadota bacterium]